MRKIHGGNFHFISTETKLSADIAFKRLITNREFSYLFTILVLKPEYSGMAVSMYAPPPWYPCPLGHQATSDSIIDYAGLKNTIYWYIHLFVVLMYGQGVTFL